MQFWQISLLIICLCSTLAVSGQEQKLDKNIFSQPPSQDNNSPSFETKPAKQKAQNMLGGNIPDFRQIREIPSLTPKQRRQIRAIYKNAKSDIKPLVEQVKNLRQQIQGGQPKGSSMSDQNNSNMTRPEMHAQMKQLVDDIKSKRQALWQKAQLVLTDSQLAQFEEMRKGQLMLPGH